MLVKLYAEGQQGKDANTINIKFHPETEEYFREVLKDEPTIRKTKNEIHALIHAEVMETVKPFYYSLFNADTICRITAKLNDIAREHQCEINKIIAINSGIGGLKYENDNE